MRLISIASGSSGNCVLVESEDTHILVDVGLTRKRIKENLAEVGRSLSDIDAIVLTHEHIDHIKGVGVISRMDNIQMYSTLGTYEGIQSCNSLGKMDASLFHTISTEKPFTVGDIEITSFDTFHDTNEPCGYTFTQDDKKAAVITDTGTFDDMIVENLLNVNALLIESNHDIKMLKEGDYPVFLKERILSHEGHLSNLACSKLLSEILHDDIEGILLGHLSEHNNDPEIALNTVKIGIDLNKTQYVASDFNISVADRDNPSKPIEF